MLRLMSQPVEYFSPTGYSDAILQSTTNYEPAEDQRTMENPQASAPVAPPAIAIAAAYAEHVELTTDKWEAHLCQCFSFSSVNWCMVSCLPCISLAQVSQRVGYAKYWVILLVLVGLWAAETVVMPIMWGFYPQSNITSGVSWLATLWILWQPSSSDEGSPSSEADAIDTANTISTALLSIATMNMYLLSVSRLAIIVLTWILRHRIRSMLEIKGNCFVDGLVSVCCTCCAIAQMTTQVKSYRQGNCDVGPVDTLPAYLPN